MSRLGGSAVFLLLASCATARSEGVSLREALGEGGCEQEVEAVAQAAPRRVPRVRTFALSWPVEPAVVTSPYGLRIHPVHGRLKQHLGTDLEASPGQGVLASERGQIRWAGWNGAYGNHIEVDHGRGLITRYSHLDALFVREGESVDKGDLIGLAGRTGLATGVHVHFELMYEGQWLDPEAHLPAPSPQPLAAR